MKTLKKFTLPANATRGSTSTYDWTKMLDGGLYQMIEGEDFTSKPANMRNMIDFRAKMAYLSCEIRLFKTEDEPATIEFQTTPMTQEEREQEDARRAQRAISEAANKAAKAAKAAELETA